MLKNCLLIGRTTQDVRPVLLHAVESLGSELSVFCDLDDPEGCPQTKLAELVQTNRFDWVIVVGGDGTMSLAIDALHAIGARVPILLVPSGTANDFSRTIKEYVDAIALVETPKNDVMLVNCDVGVVERDYDVRPRHFINMVVVGPSAENSMNISRNLKQIVGSAAYLTQFYHSLTSAGAFQVSLSVDDKPLEAVNCSAVFIANGRTCGGGYSIVPHADPTDGFLDIVVVKAIDLWEKLKLATSFVSDQHLSSEAVSYYRARKLDMRFDKTQSLTLDGECTDADAVTISVAHGVQPLVVTNLEELQHADWQGISKAMFNAQNFLKQTS